MFLQIKTNREKLRDESQIDSPNSAGVVTFDDKLEKLAAASDTTGVAWSKVQVVADNREGWVRDERLTEWEDPTPIDTSAPAGDLKLGVNEIYRDAILEASNRTEIAPAALAALIDAEAAKTSGGVWNKDSKAQSSSALGLTQFLKGTWEEMAERSGTLLNETAKDKGWVSPSNQVVAANSAALLASRTDPRLSIVSAAEYAQGNLNFLRGKGLIPSGTSDDELARFAYLAHHEGPGGALAFLDGTLAEDRAAQLLVTNVGASTAAQLTTKHGSAKKAYIAWLNGYMDKKIQPSKFR